MAKRAAILEFGDLLDKDRVLCTYTDGNRYLEASVEVMQLIDEIHEIDGRLCELAGQPSLHESKLERSVILINILRGYRNQRSGLEESILLERGLL
jgi:hypothetical protein